MTVAEAQGEGLATALERWMHGDGVPDLRQGVEAFIDRLLSEDDPEGKVAALSPEVFYHLVEEVGIENAQALVALATAEHWHHAIDLVGWRRDHFLPRALEPWLGALISADNARFSRTYYALDAELLLLYLKCQVEMVVIEDFDAGPPPTAEDEAPWETSPDGAFWLRYPEEADSAALCRALVAKVYDALGVEAAWTLFNGVVWELASDLEETLFRFRSARLEDYGFVSLDEAGQIFHRIDPEAIKEEVGRLSDGYVVQVSMPEGRGLGLADALTGLAQSADFLGARISELDAAGWSVVVPQLMALARKVLVVRGHDFGDRTAQADAMGYAWGCTALGLEYCSQADPVQARRALQAIPLRVLFQAGFSMLARLRDKAVAIVQRGRLTIVEGQLLSLLLDDERDLILGLMQPRPVRSEMTQRPFSRCADFDQAALVVADVAFKEVLFYGVLGVTKEDLVAAALSASPEQGITRISFETLFATYAWRCAQGHGSFVALPAQEHPEAASLRDAIEAWTLERVLPGRTTRVMQAAARRFIRRVGEESYQALLQAPRPLDPRFVTALLLA